MDLNAIDLMLATNHPPFSRAGWIFEFKYDGYRVLASKEQTAHEEQEGRDDVVCGDRPGAA
jgi:hypothetical protein